MLGKRHDAGLVIAGAVTAIYVFFVRQWHLHWGATEEEARGAAVGDDLMPDPDLVATRAVEIDAPPSAIWPWLVQMGPGRGGAYTYDWIERRLGIDIRNTDRIIPELQDLKVGDEIPMPGYSMRVERLDPPRPDAAASLMRTTWRPAASATVGEGPHAEIESSDGLLYGLAG